MDVSRAEQQERLFFYLALVLPVLFALAPVFPQLTHPEFTFLFRSVLFLFAGCAIYAFGWSAVINRARTSQITAPLLAIVFVAIAALFYSPDIYEAKVKVSLLVSVFILYILSLLYPNGVKRQNRALFGLALGGLFAALMALYQQYAGHSRLIEALQTTPLYEDQMRQEMIVSLTANRAMGEFGNPNHLAGFLGITLWAGWLLYQRTKSRFSGLLFLLYLLITGFAIYQTYSRSGLLALVFTFFCWLVYYGYQKKAVTKKTVLIALAFCALMGVVFYFLKDHLLGGRLLVSSTLLARLHFYRGGLLIIQEFPFFGVGTGGFESYYGTVLRPGDLESRFVHNILLEYALEWGVIGLGMLFWLIFSLSKAVLRVWRENIHQRAVVVAAFGSLGTLFLLSLVDFHNNLTEMLVTPVFMAGLFAGVNTAGLGGFDPAGETVPALGRTRKIRDRICSILLLAAWFVLVLLPFGNRLNRENGYFLLVDQQYAKARECYEWAVFFDFTDAGSWNHLAHLWKLNPTPHAANFVLQYSEKAVQWQPRRASLRADYAEALFSLGFAEEAVAQMKTAQALFPSRPAYYERLANLYRMMGNEALATQQLNTAETLKEMIEERKI